MNSSTDDFVDMLGEFRNPPAWHRQAACKSRPDLSWVPARGEPVHEQKAVCSECPVRAECLRAGIDGLELGVWGGTLGRERQRLRLTAA